MSQYTCVLHHVPEACNPFSLFLFPVLFLKFTKTQNSSYHVKHLLQIKGQINYSYLT